MGGKSWDPHHPLKTIPVCVLLAWGQKQAEHYPHIQIKEVLKRSSFKTWQYTDLCQIYQPCKELHMSQPVPGIVLPSAEMHPEGNYTNRQPELLASPKFFLWSYRSKAISKATLHMKVPAACVCRRAVVQWEARACNTQKELLIQGAASDGGSCLPVASTQLCWLEEQQNIWAVVPSLPHSRTFHYFFSKRKFLFSFVLLVSSDEQ